MTKAQIKFVQSLNMQKYRKESQSYLVEGEKNVKEWLQSSCEISNIFAEKEWISKNESSIPEKIRNIIVEAAPHELEKITSLKNAQKVIMVVKMKKEIHLEVNKSKWYLYLESVRDPGNMGTIIRTADWFGIHHIILSPECVDIYNPKVVQATMGSMTRMDYSLADHSLIKDIIDKHDIPLYATSLKGENVFKEKKIPPGIVAFGNESKGLSTEISELATSQLLIPKMGKAESLNIAIAVGIFCAVLTNQQ